MPVTNLELYNEIMRVLIEDADDGVAELASGLYTRADIASQLDSVLQEFNKLTQVTCANGYESPTVAGVRNIQAPPDAILLKEVSFLDADGHWNTIPAGSIHETESMLDDTETSASIPSVYAIDGAPNLSITLVPPPDSNSYVQYAYVNKPSTVDELPTESSVDCPDDLTPYIKYGALANIFGNSGETYDPFRAELCQQIYELGIEVAKGWVVGK